MTHSELPTFSIGQLMEAGVHFGHKTMRWNPKMAPYLFGSRDNIHIIDLQQTVPMLHQALQVVYDTVKENGRVLFVATKKQASEHIAEAAKRCGQYYVNHRWLGGMLTNWGTVSKSIKAMCELEAKLQQEGSEYRMTKKERLEMQRSYEKLERSLGGIRNMGGKPDLLFIIDTNKESLAILEAKKLNIPIVAIIDSNSDPDSVDYPIPGNDDSTRSIKLYSQLISDSALAGIKAALIKSGADIGELNEDGSINIEEFEAMRNSSKEKAAAAQKKAAPKKASDKKLQDKKDKIATTAERKTTKLKAAKSAEAEAVSQESQGE
jgi:small subunit ribosomal protein S2